MDLDINGDAFRKAVTAPFGKKIALYAEINISVDNGYHGHG
jgi:hypothetical protein